MPHIYKSIGASKLTNINITSLLKKQLIIGKETYLGKDIYMSGNINIGDYSFIGPNSDIQAGKDVNIVLGKYCSIARNCSLIASNFHSKDKITTRTLPGMPIRESGKNIVLGNDVWIGVNTTIIYGVRIGNGVIIGAGSVVTKDIPSYSIAVGNPAKVIAKRFTDKTIEKLEESKWWDWKIEKIIQNYDLNFENKTIGNFE